MVYRKDGHGYLGAAPAKKAVQRMKGSHPTDPEPGIRHPGVDVADLNPVLRGWAAYFSYGTRLMAYRAVDQYVAQRVRHFLRRRHKVPTRGTRRFSTEIIFGELGVVRLRRVHLGSPVQASVCHSSESRMRENRTSGSMSGMWKRV